MGKVTLQQQINDAMCFLALLARYSPGLLISIKSLFGSNNILSDGTVIPRQGN